MNHLRKLQAILDKHGVKSDITVLLNMWNSAGRHYHSEAHLHDLVRIIDHDHHAGLIDNETEYEQLLLAAIFHDIVYQPGRGDNEEQSAAVFLNACTRPQDPLLRAVHQAILDTKTHVATTSLSARFNKYDMNIVERGYEELLEWEKGIYEEYKGAGTQAYKMGRLAFIRSLIPRYPGNRENLERLAAYVANEY